MILSCQNICKQFGENSVLENCSFHIEDHEKAAIVGINGAGKTTLLRIITGEMSADSGSAVFAKGKSFGYLAQHDALTSDETIYNELLRVKEDIIRLEEQIRSLEQQMKHFSGQELEQKMNHYAALTEQFEQLNGYAYKSELTGVLKGLGFTKEDYDRKIDTLSGGQKTRVALARLLLQNPDLILLDEPTNHLDMSSISWLETYLLNYKGAVVVVSHDRYFLNRIAQKIIEIDQAQTTVFPGNYSDYAVKKEQLRNARLNAYLNQQREIRRQEEVIEKLRSFNREKSIRRAESREKMLQKIETVDKPLEVKADMHLRLSPRFESGKDVLHVSELAKTFGSHSLFSNISFELKRGEHVAIIGDNGTGKTTILKMLNGLLLPDAGEIKIGAGVHIGYYDQEHHVLHSEKSLFDEISDSYPALTNTQIRSTLAAFLFTGDDVFKRIGDLSGGERGRVSLAKLMLSEANFLILDEPTNHLDILSKEILEDALNHYEGTILYVSHDRYFINRTAQRILDLSDGAFTGYLGNYDYYLEKKESLGAQAALRNTAHSLAPDSCHNVSGQRTKDGVFSRPTAFMADAETTSDSKLSWKAQKEEQARIRRLENALSKAEEEITSLEAQNRHLDERMVSPEVCTDVPKLTELAREKENNESRLEQLYDEWETLSEELGSFS